MQGRQCLEVKPYSFHGSHGGTFRSPAALVNVDHKLDKQIGKQKSKILVNKRNRQQHHQEKSTSIYMVYIMQVCITASSPINIQQINKQYNLPIEYCPVMPASLLVI
jgi:hypothetical protein